ncbi:MAG: hypothetical protein GX310_10505 [Synergistaceae bacterium]|nr:hypothetical protein [Synergistaceae bacterium]
MNSRIAGKVTALVLAVVLVLSLADAGAALVRKGKFNGPYGVEQLVNVNPGQKFTVRTTSEEPAIVTITSTSYVGNNKMGGSLVKKTDAATHHFFEYRAPDKRPANSSIYQYYVKIYAPVNKWVEYTLEIY